MPPPITWNEAWKSVSASATAGALPQPTNNLGIVYYTQGQYASAEGCYQQALSTWTEVGDTSGIAFCHANLGELYFSDGKLEEAAQHLERGNGGYLNLVNRGHSSMPESGWPRFGWRKTGGKRPGILPK